MSETGDRCAIAAFRGAELVGVTDALSPVLGNSDEVVSWLMEQPSFGVAEALSDALTKTNVPGDAWWDDVARHYGDEARRVAVERFSGTALRDAEGDIGPIVGRLTPDGLLAVLNGDRRLLRTLAGISLQCSIRNHEPARMASVLGVTHAELVSRVHAITERAVKALGGPLVLGSGRGHLSLV